MVANGRRLQCLGVCHNISLTIGDHTLCVPCDSITGVWRCARGELAPESRTNSMGFFHNVYVIYPQGQSNSLARNIPRRQAPCSATYGHLRSELCNRGSAKPTGRIVEYACLFLEPAGLPPSKNFTHRITLEQGRKPVVVRPYRYPHAQKDEIERQCGDVGKGPDSPKSFTILITRTVGEKGGCLLEILYRLSGTQCKDDQ